MEVTSKALESDSNSEQEHTKPHTMEKRQGLTRKMLRMMFLLLICSLFVITVQSAKGPALPPNAKKGYLYAGTDDASPVIEFEGPDDRPDFVLSRNKGHRVVEFYAPWCPHVS